MPRHSACGIRDANTGFRPVPERGPDENPCSVSETDARSAPVPSTGPRLVLASASPRRQELLREAGYAFDLDPANIDEDDYPPALTPPELAEFLAMAKARAVAE